MRHKLWLLALLCASCGPCDEEVRDREDAKFFGLRAAHTYTKVAVEAPSEAPPSMSVQDTEPCKGYRAIVTRTGGPCALEQGANKDCTRATCPNCAEYVPAYAAAGAIPGCL